MSHKGTKILRHMPDVKMNNRDYYKVDKYKKFLSQAYNKNRRNDVVPFKNAHIFKEHNLYYPSK